jgi:hypothetical protein
VTVKLLGRAVNGTRRTLAVFPHWSCKATFI